MRAVLASIKTKWSEKIYSREKSVEVRKTAPTPESGVWDRHLTVYLYESGTGLVTGEFEMCGVEWSGAPYFSTGNTCLTDVELKAYGPDRHGWYCGWQIASATKYDVPKKLSDFYRPCISPEMPYCPTCPVGGEYISESESEFLAVDGECRTEWYCNNRLTRPPQSWCYVEELNDGK